MSTHESKPLNTLIQDAIVKNWDGMALSDMGGINYQFKDVAETIEKLHLMFEAAGVKKGDKIALCGKNSSTWAVIFLASLTYGSVIVPILHEFKPDTIHHLVNHSDSLLLFTDKAIWEDLDEKKMPQLNGVIFISEFGMPLCRNEKLRHTRDNINEIFGSRYPYSFSKKDVNYAPEDPEDLALISYTSGSTGMSKGVMLPYRSILSNIEYTFGHLHFLKAGDGIVNMLPLAHLYGMVIEMLHPFVKGCHCNFLTRVPSPKIILDAFSKVRPKLIITVPLIIEKIVKTRVFPTIEKPMTKFMLRLPFVNRIILSKIRSRLMEAFGGQVEEIIIGGAPLNADVEAFLKRVDFPVTVGYGMTECGPLVTYAPPAETKPHTVGRIVDRMEARVDSPDPENVPGNLWVRGANVMKGYYKNEEATREVMPDDSGWMNTGDMCMIDSDGFVTVCGRSKTMILGPSGQNIYPEEIEQKINNLPYVVESLVISEGGKLVGLIYPDYEEAARKGLDRAALEALMDNSLKTLNADLPAYSKVSRVKLMDEEFEKTPKRSIKRFLYQP